MKLRVRTLVPYLPPPTMDVATQLTTLGRTRWELQGRIEAADGLDPGRMRARCTPGIGPARLVRLSFAQWLALIAAHDRRHLWLARRVVAEPTFPRCAAADRSALVGTVACGTDECRARRESAATSTSRNGQGTTPLRGLRIGET